MSFCKFLREKLVVSFSIRRNMNQKGLIVPNVRVGQPAPNVTLQNLDDEPVQLAEMWGNGRHALIIYLRHLA